MFCFEHELPKQPSIKKMKCLFLKENHQSNSPLRSGSALQFVYYFSAAQVTWNVALQGNRMQVRIQISWHTLTEITLYYFL